MPTLVAPQRSSRHSAQVPSAAEVDRPKSWLRRLGRVSLASTRDKPNRGPSSRATRNEARLVPAAVRLAELRLVDAPISEQQLELVAEVGTHHLLAVSRDRERDAML
jgi:hypothetical protein